jgi:hypothetical protein
MEKVRPQLFGAGRFADLHVRSVRPTSAARRCRRLCQRARCLRVGTFDGSRALMFPIRLSTPPIVKDALP